MARERSRANSRRNYAPRSTVAFIVCRLCGQPSTVKSSRATVCYRQECRLAQNAERAAAYFERYALEHGEPYKSRYYEQINAKRRAEGYTENKRMNDAIRRARKAGATVEKFENAEIFERDAWVCGICDERIDRALSWPDPQSVSLDHVKPLSLGGDHSRANTRAAHLRCNIARGNRVDESAA